MNAIAKKSIKTALVFAAVGALVALAMPAVMTALAGAGVISSAGTAGALTLEGVAHTTGVFALFGALEPLLQSVMNDFVGGNSVQEKASAKPIDAIAPQVATAVAPEKEHGCGCHKHREQVEASRQQAIEQMLSRN